MTIAEAKAQGAVTRFHKRLVRIPKIRLGNKKTGRPNAETTRKTLVVSGAHRGLISVSAHIRRVRGRVARPTSVLGMRTQGWDRQGRSYPGLSSRAPLGRGQTHGSPTWPLHKGHPQATSSFVFSVHARHAACLSVCGLGV